MDKKYVIAHFEVGDDELATCLNDVQMVTHLNLERLIEELIDLHHMGLPSFAAIQQLAHRLHLDTTMRLGFKDEDYIVVTQLIYDTLVRINSQLCKIMRFRDPKELWGQIQLKDTDLIMERRRGQHALL